jgi:Zn-finger nucleic acid-binding protein
MSEMSCPRCKLPLRKVEYEGVEADMCDVCWGFWLDSGELEVMLENPQIEFSEDERKAVLDIRVASQTGPTNPTQCPKCGRIMKRVHYDSMVHLVIDCCEDHGVWLDTGEIKKVQALAFKSQEYHRLLLKKLGVIPQA